MTHTRTFVLLEVSKSAFEEIKKRIIDAGAQELIDEERGQVRLQMDGIALVEEGKR